MNIKICKNDNLIQHLYPIIYIGNYKIWIENSKFLLTTYELKNSQGFPVVKVHREHKSLWELIRHISTNLMQVDVDELETEFLRLEKIKPVSYPEGSCKL